VEYLKLQSIEVSKPKTYILQNNWQRIWDINMARMTIRDLGYTPGQLPPEPKNSILDVKGKSASNP
jgi:hypothetical protein